MHGFLWQLFCTGTLGAADRFGFSWVPKAGASTLPFAFLPSSKHWEFCHVLPLAGRCLRNLVLPKDLNGACLSLSPCLELTFTEHVTKSAMFRWGALGTCVFAVPWVKWDSPAKQGTKGFYCTILIYSSDTASDKARSKFIPGATPKMSCIWSIEFVT